MGKRAMLIGCVCLVGLAIPFFLENLKAETIIEKQIVVGPIILEQYDTLEQKGDFFQVPLPEDLQKHIFEECGKANIAPELVFAMIEQESSYNSDAVGDESKSVGLLQIQAKWHSKRMERLGCTDLSDPYQNITVAVDFLYELFEKNEDVYWVLMAYNGGEAYATRKIDKGEYSEYAVKVSTRAMELERGE